jgi:hypothetical protein
MENLIELSKQYELIIELFVILLKLNSTQDHEDAKEIKNHDDLSAILNPRYFERINQLKNAKHKIYSSDIIVSSKYNIFRSY